MFPQLLIEFEDRVQEVDLYFQVLESFDNAEIAIVRGNLAQIVAVGQPPADWGRMLKGASFLVLYNLVEAFIRKGFQAVFDAIKSEGLCGIDLIEQLRVQWVMQKNRKVSTFDGSPGVYMKIANEVVSEVIAKTPVRLKRDHLPISGNLDADVVREVCDLHGVDHTVPPAAKGGFALENVKRKRNSLSHGDESFVEVGRTTTTADLVRAKGEVVIFVRSILKNLEKYANDKSYKV